MNIAEKLAEASTAEVESPEGSGLYWRVRKVTSADLAKVQVAALRMVIPAGTEIESEDPMDQARAISRVSDRDIEKVEQMATGVVCAGAVAVRSGDDGEWEPIRIVANIDERDPSKNVIHVTDLPAGVEGALYKAIDSLHKDSKGAAERLARFR